jgi:hypothetical protein
MRKEMMRFSWLLQWSGLALLAVYWGRVLYVEVAKAGMGWGEAGLLLVLSALLFFCLGLILLAMQQKAQPAGLGAGTRLALYYTPRLATLLFSVLICLLALDVFPGEGGVWKTLVAFVVHLLPGLGLLVGCLLAWRYEWLGALVFMGWGVFYVLFARGFGVMVYVEVAVLPFSLGVLYLLNWFYRADLRPARG